MWNKITKEWCEPPVVDGANGLAIAFSPLDGTYVRYFSKDEKVIVQYTGLLDIKGNEIYESYLLKDDENFIWEVKYKQGMFVAICDDLMAEQPLNTINLYAEIVGNIFDDKELIE